MGGAQPLAITMNEGVALIAEVEEWRIDKRLETKYLDIKIAILMKPLIGPFRRKKKRKPCQSACFAMPFICWKDW